LILVRVGDAWGSSVTEIFVGTVLIIAYVS
jgi:hypothetical protein